METMHLSYTVFAIQRVICRKLLTDGTPVEFREHLWHQKTRVPGLSCGIVYVILFSGFDTISACDRRTHDDSTYRASIASRENN